MLEMNAMVNTDFFNDQVFRLYFSVKRIISMYNIPFTHLIYYYQILISPELMISPVLTG